MKTIFSVKAFLIFHVVLVLLFATCANVRAQAFQSGNPGAEPQQAVYYQKAETAYLNAASQADAAGQPDRAACYRKWATYYHGCAAQLVSGTTFRVGSPPSDGCSRYGGAASSPATSGAANNSGNSFGITTETFNKLNPGQQGLIAGLSALNGLLQQHQQELKRQQQAEENETDQNKKALEFWIPAAKRANEIMAKPDFDQFQSESSFVGKSMPNPDWFIKSIQAGGARADFARQETPETAKEIEKIESEYTTWQIHKVERDAKQVAENIEIAREAATLSDNPAAIREQLVACLTSTAGADCNLGVTKLKIQYTRIVADEKELTIESKVNMAIESSGDTLPPFTEKVNISWGALKSAEVTLTEEFESMRNRPYKMNIKTTGKDITVRSQGEDNPEDKRQVDNKSFYLGTNEAAARKTVTLLQRAVHIAP